MAVDSQTIPSLIQGISQQSEISRGSASAEDQLNCLNEVLDGVVNRMGSVTKADINQTYTDPFVHTSMRSRDEVYMMIVEDGVLRIFNTASGVEATITGSIATYLAHTGVGRKAFKAVTVGDTTFIANRETTVLMNTATSAARDNDAMAHFKAGAYKTKYTMSIVIGASTYSITYTTPDNSAAANAEFITTTFLANEFNDAIIATLIPALDAAGHTGFTSAVSGSTIIVYGPTTGTGVPYTIDTSDGQGDRQFISFKDNVKDFADLPLRSFDGYEVSVSGEANDDASKYYLRYDGGATTGEWVEVVAPAVEETLDADTMPHLIVNTALNAFTVSTAAWGDRLVGDGDLTAKDPSFVGNTIQSIQFISGRLAAVSDYKMVLSRARNAYVFFPDTVQTDLDTAPIDYDISNGSTTAITHAVMAGGRLQFWGDIQQTYLDSGNDPLREDTTEILPMANYEFDGQVDPKPIGLASLVFGSTLGRWSRVVELFFRNGKADGEIAITAHCPKLIDGKLRYIASGEAAGKSAYGADGDPNTLYLYEWYNQGDERVQSAWNKWSMDSPTSVLWADIIGSTMYLLVQWTAGCTIETIILDSDGDETGVPFPIRLDHRVDETSATHDAASTFTLTLPYDVVAADRDLFACVERTDEADVSQRGRDLAFTWTSNTTVEITSTNAALEFFFGAIPVARRKASRFWAKDSSDQPILHEKLLVKGVRVAHSDTVTYDVEVTKYGGTVTVQTFTGRVLGDPTLTNAEVPVSTSSFYASVGEEVENADIELVNRTVFPATWSAMEYTYELTKRVNSSGGRR